MSERGRSEKAFDDGGFAGVGPAGVALVPVAQPMEWTRQPSLPASNFIAQLLATTQQVSGTTVADARSAYGASLHPARGTGIRTRQII